MPCSKTKQTHNFQMHECPYIVSFKALAYEQLLFDKHLKLVKHNVSL